MNTSSFKQILKFSLPCILMQMVLSLYTIIDGMFISRFVGDIALGGTNIIFPVVSLQMAVGIMISTGGAAIVSKLRGEGKIVEARSYTTMLLIISISISLIISSIGLIFINNILDFFNPTINQRPYAFLYGKYALIFGPFMFLQVFFQSFFITTDKPKLALITTITGGILNIVLDYLFMGVFKMGIIGASIATGIGYMPPGIVGLIYFSKKSCILRFKKPMFKIKIIINSMTNGLSEMISNLAFAVSTFLYNIMFIKYYGEMGVSAITVILYFQFLFGSIFFGYSIGISPVIAYKYGQNNMDDIKMINKNSLILQIITGIILFIISNLTIKPILGIFVTPNGESYNIALEGFFKFSTSFLFMGIPIYISALFTALQNGFISGVVSSSRTLIFLSISIIILPLIFNSNGLWFSAFTANLLGSIVGIILLFKYKKRYNY